MPVRHRSELWLLKCVKTALRILPGRCVHFLAGTLGNLIYYMDRKHRRIALSNLGIALGDRTERERKRIARAAFRHFATVLFELLTLPKSLSERFSRISRHGGLENLQEAYAAGKGVLIFTAHFGNWELMGISHGTMGFPLSVLARALDNREIEKELYGIRACSGNHVIPKEQAIKGSLEALKRKEGVAILIDQNTQLSQGIFVDFFGREACTTTILAALAIKTGARIIPAFALPEGRGRYCFIYEPPVPVPPADMEVTERIKKITQDCTKIIEGYVTKYPEYWLWMHQRWKTRPEGIE